MSYESNLIIYMNKFKSILRLHGYDENFIEENIIEISYNTNPNYKRSTPGILVKKLGLVILTNRSTVYTLDDSFENNGELRIYKDRFGYGNFVNEIKKAYPPLRPLFIYS